MTNFWLIQRGTFRKTGKLFIGKDGIVSLDYMGASEFEWGAIPNALRCLMYRFSEYEVFNTRIFTPENDELMVLCKKSCSTEVIQSICQYIEKQYHLKEYSEL